jgi:hypothetical protein
VRNKESSGKGHDRREFIKIDRAVTAGLLANAALLKTVGADPRIPPNPAAAAYGPPILMAGGPVPPALQEKNFKFKRESTRSLGQPPITIFAWMENSTAL